MNLKNRFARLFTKTNHDSELKQASITDPASQWDELTALNPDTADTTFDSLSTVPFAGDSSATESSVAPQHVLPLPEPASEHNITDTDEQEEAEFSPNLQAFKNFFNTDLRIKRELMQVAPHPEDDYDVESRMRYVEQAYSIFESFRDDFAQIDHDFFGLDLDSDRSSTADFFQRGAEHFSPRRYDAGITDRIYQNEFTRMRPDFIEKVKAECFGYAAVKNLNSLIQASQSINELLHTYHSYIMNNEELLQAIPPVAEKENKEGYPITLRGESSALAQQLFAAFPEELSAGWTDIVSVGDHIITMVRDRGHALVINAEPDDAHPDKIWVEYNIPKLCNIDMIKALPGLSGYTENGARGSFFVPRDEFGNQIIDFISQVPMDEDMFKPGDTLYGRI